MISTRSYHSVDAASVDLIMKLATRELRTIYALKPPAETPADNHSLSGTRIVAVDGSETVVGVAEFIVQPAAIYAQGIAVAATHRRRGVAKALLAHIAALAIDKSLPAIRVATIKETGNVEIFKRLGFEVTEERISERFFGLNGQPVTVVTLHCHIRRPSGIK